MSTLRLTPQRIMQLQADPKCVRNICILAHVDHGKTTLADSLIATNGIISERLAGEIRYLDSREDEQERGITMKSSVVTLHYISKSDNIDHLINLIDSPGHVDFSTEVSTAVRICDGAYVVVDVVEGAGPQTSAVLRQAWMERIRPILVLNKIDRLFTELKLSPIAVYEQLRKIVEQVNAIIGQFFHSDLYELSGHENHSTTNKSDPDLFGSWAVNFDGVDDTGVFFQPELGNVVFASAVDKWAFSLKNFATFYASRLGIAEKELLSGLWGDYYYEATSKTCKPGAAEKGKTPLFVKVVMENIWTIYDAVIQGNFEKVMKISTQLQLDVNERRLAKSDNRLKLQSVLGKWLPMADSLLEAAVLCVPSPANLPEDRIERLLSSQLSVKFSSLPESTKSLKQIFMACKDSADVPTIIFVSKLFPVSAAALTADARRRIINTGTDNQVFLAFARIFSGTVRPNQKVFLIESKYIPTDLNAKYSSADIDPSVELPEYVKVVEIGDIFFLMGREVEKIDEIRAGNVFGISGLDSHIFKCGTLSTTLACPPFLPISAHSIPIVQVAIEPVRPSDDAALQTGLQLLYRSDPCVEVSVSNTSGEFLMRTAGEVHLHRCLADLKERFAGIELRVSQPTVPFRETITASLPGMKPTATEIHEGVIEPGLVKMSSTGGFLTVTIRASPISSKMTDLITSKEHLIKQMHRTSKMRESGKLVDLGDDSFLKLKSNLAELVESHKSPINVENILSFGPRHSGANIFLIADEKNLLAQKTIWRQESKGEQQTSETLNLLSIFNSIINGFQLAVSSGPICEEPMSGVCFSIVDMELSPNALDHISLGSLSGQTVSLVKDCCRKAFSSMPQRLLVAMYSCTVQTSPETLGKLHGVISRRCGRVINEDANDTCSQFVITATIPVIESFGLAEELRKKTSGLVLDPQLKFSHWEILDADPTTVVADIDEEEDNESQETALHSHARRYMLTVRRRKGLPTGEQLVVNAEKQRTLSKKK